MTWAGRHAGRLLSWRCTALAVLALLAIGSGSGASTVAPTVVGMGSGSVVPGGDIELALRAEGVPAPGLGAVTVTVSYDSQIVDAVGCNADPAQVLGLALCNVDFEHDGVGRDSVGMTGIDAAGAAGDVTLATIRFRGNDVGGVTSLRVIVTTLSDPDGQQIAAAAADGRVTVTTAVDDDDGQGPTRTATPTPTGIPTATPAPTSPAFTPVPGAMELVTLVGGTCNPVTSTYPRNTAPVAIAGAVSPAGILSALWGFESGIWHGFSPQFPDMSDLTEVEFLGVVFICTRSGGSFSRPTV